MRRIFDITMFSIFFYPYGILLVVFKSRRGGITTTTSFSAYGRRPAEGGQVQATRYAGGR
jgi:hypothetical protein